MAKTSRDREQEKLQRRKKVQRRLKYKKIIKDGIINQNPIFIQLLGMCSALAISTSVFNALGMGVSVIFVLVFSNAIISLLRNFIPSKIRIASYVVIIAGLTSIVDMVLKAYIPVLSNSLGLFIPLIVVNCIILARAESFASKNGVFSSMLDGLSSGIGYTFALLAVAVVREILGNGTLFGITIMGENFSPALLLILPPGGFLILGTLIAIFQGIIAKKANKKEGK